MSLATQVRAIATRAAAMRQEIHGIDNNGDAQTGRMEDDADPTHTFLCYFSADKSGEASIELGFKEVHDFILRVAKTELNIDPTIGKRIRLLAAGPNAQDLVVRITTVGGPSALNPEWILGCKNDF